MYKDLIKGKIFPKSNAKGGANTPSGGVKPYVAKDKEEYEYRKQSYNDSLALHQLGENAFNSMKKTKVKAREVYGRSSVHDYVDLDKNPVLDAKKRTIRTTPYMGSNFRGGVKMDPATDTSNETAERAYENRLAWERKQWDKGINTGGDRDYYAPEKTSVLEVELGQLHVPGTKYNFTPPWMESGTIKYGVNRYKKPVQEVLPPVNDKASGSANRAATPAPAPWKNPGSQVTPLASRMPQVAQPQLPAPPAVQSNYQKKHKMPVIGVDMENGWLRVPNQEGARSNVMKNLPNIPKYREQYHVDNPEAQEWAKKHLKRSGGVMPRTYKSGGVIDKPKAVILGGLSHEEAKANGNGNAVLDGPEKVAETESEELQLTREQSTYLMGMVARIDAGEEMYEELGRYMRRVLKEETIDKSGKYKL
jgi:hypothetical protein